MDMRMQTVLDAALKSAVTSLVVCFVCYSGLCSNKKVTLDQNGLAMVLMFTCVLTAIRLLAPEIHSAVLQGVGIAVGATMVGWPN